MITTGPVNGIDFNVEGDNSTRAFLYYTEPDPCVPYTGEWFSYDVTATVQAWQDGSMVNNGFYGYASGYWQNVKWYTSEYTDDPCLRPKLTVSYFSQRDVFDPCDPCNADTAFFKQGLQCRNGPV